MNKKIFEDIATETMKSRFKVYKDFLKLPENDNVIEFCKKIDVFGSPINNLKEFQMICLILETVVSKSLETFKTKQKQIYNEMKMIDTAFSDNPQIKTEVMVRLASYSGLFLKNMYELSSFIDYYIKTVKEKE